MLAQPTVWGDRAWLDPGQWIGLGAVVAGTWMLMLEKEFA
jgi:hypothetical protein